MIVIDSGPLVAAVNIRDNHHEICARLLRTHPGPLLVPVTVVTEVCQLIEKRQGGKAEAAFLRSFQSGLVLIDLINEDLDRMIDLVEIYANLPLGAADASVIAVAERLGLAEVATLDRRHFTVVRPRHLAAFTLLPERL
ncbi:type II toxin-antitoxin system VapC family toxin [Streptosporangium sp. 'caverna']|uniref:type II toxin-antitoxin system VapC family toxin n=1 Tax=Streptosporangium sp. 'caverna' TaxID=2202249 RepID=UPI000D7E11DF|nr:PIN domain-containing protein [Streptosporangium sp. 'caverna']AWS41358.1 VapC toxin family PIN domain ribonuclease [Streptosporangium sp. 'caverna']